MLTTGLIGRFNDALTGGIAVRTTVVVAALLALAVGVKVPQRFAMWVSLSAWRKFLSRGQSSDLPNGLPNAAPADRASYWMLLAVVALAAGAGTALTPLTARMSLAGYEWLQDRFVWSMLPLVVLHGLVVLGAGLIPWAALGLAVSLTHRSVLPAGDVGGPERAAWFWPGPEPGRQ